MSYTHNPGRGVVDPSLPVRLSTGASVAAAGLGALAGVTLGTFLTATGSEWGSVVTAPLLALATSLVAFHPYRQVRLEAGRLPLARMAATVSALLFSLALATNDPVMMGAALWVMTGTTLLVIALLHEDKIA